MGLPNYRNTFSLFALVSMATLTKTQWQMAVAHLSGLNSLSWLPSFTYHFSTTYLFTSFKSASVKSRLRPVGPEASLRHWYTDVLGINHGEDPEAIQRVTFIMNSCLMLYSMWNMHWSLFLIVWFIPGPLTIYLSVHVHFVVITCVYYHLWICGHICVYQEIHCYL